MCASTEVPIYSQCPCISWICKSPEGVRSVLLVVCQIDPALTISFKYRSDRGPCDRFFYFNYLNIIALTVLAIHCSCSITCKNGKPENVSYLGQLCQPFMCIRSLHGSLGTLLRSTIRLGWLPRGLSYMHVMLLLSMLGTIHTCAYIYVHTFSHVQMC